MFLLVLTFLVMWAGLFGWLLLALERWARSW